MYLLILGVLFRFPAEKVHHFVFGIIRLIGILQPIRLILARIFRQHYPELSQTIFGKTFPGPLGLAAGFDKNAHALNSWGALGFGFAEVGTITALAQPGNPAPRLFRLPEDRALLNRMGFNNNGAGAVTASLRTLRSDKWAIPIGANIGKSKIVELKDAAYDYLHSAQMVSDFVDFLVINVSSPNTPDLRKLQNTQYLDEIHLTLINYSITKPILVKISPDLGNEEIITIADWAIEHNIAGIIATNTTIHKDNLRTSDAYALGDGGISGAPLKDRSLEVLRLLYKHTAGKILLISVGGIETVQDAWERITSGASLIESYTGYIYGGPLWPRKIHKGLKAKLDEHGLRHISQAIGLTAAHNS